MKLNFFLTAILLACFLTISAQAQKSYDQSALDKLEWKLAAQAYTFRFFTLEETLDKMNALGLRYVELYPSQKIGGGMEGQTHFTMDEQTRNKVKAMLQKKGITPVNYGVVRGNSKEEWIQIFEFAKAMGIETIVVEPLAQHIDLLEDLCEQYKIKLAIHNHPKPSRYWHPEIAVSVLAARSNNLGVSADIGHWARSGVDPLEAVKMLEGRIIAFHFKDLNEFGVRKAHDVPWGTGVCNVAGIMHELKRQGFKGVFSIEYEYNWENSVPEIAESIAYFNRVAHWLLQE